MTTFTERRRSGGFIISEAPGSLSRDNGVLASGEVCQAGELLMVDTGKLVAWDGDGDVAGILMSWTDATGGDTAVATIARLAEVNFDLLVYPDGAEDNVEAALDLIGVIASAANIGAGGGGGGDLPVLPDGFAFVVDGDNYVVDGNGDFVITEQ